MKKIGIIHPNLGIGGAERLIIDIAKILKKQGNHVEIYTNYYDKNRNFLNSYSISTTSTNTNEEVNINEHFSFIPDSIFGVFKVYMAILKIILLTIYLIIYDIDKYDIIIVDQIGVISIGLIKLFCKKNIIYYCHYPDQLLTDRLSWYKYYYRYIADCLEKYCTSYADIILVNSNFTLNVLVNTFDNVRKMYESNRDYIKIIYPSVEIDEFLINNELYYNILPNKPFNLFVSINRFDSKKLIERALTGMYLLKTNLNNNVWNNTHLIIMGGCDPNSSSDNYYYQYLYQLAIDYKLIDIDNADFNKVTFLTNPSDRLKFSILSNALCMIYTPDYEHFGIAPIEAMLLGVPVLSSNTGGPLETIIHGKTGFHLTDFNTDLVKYMCFMIENPQKRMQMSQAATEHIQNNFSFKNMQDQISQIIALFN